MDAHPSQCLYNNKNESSKPSSKGLPLMYGSPGSTGDGTSFGSINKATEAAVGNCASHTIHKSPTRRKVAHVDGALLVFGAERRGFASGAGLGWPFVVLVSLIVSLFLWTPSYGFLGVISRLLGTVGNRGPRISSRVLDAGPNRGESVVHGSGRRRGRWALRCQMGEWAPSALRGSSNRAPYPSLALLVSRIVKDYLSFWEGKLTSCSIPLKGMF